MPGGALHPTLARLCFQFDLPQLVWQHRGALSIMRCKIVFLQQGEHQEHHPCETGGHARGLVKDCSNDIDGP